MYWDHHTCLSVPLYPRYTNTPRGHDTRSESFLSYADGTSKLAVDPPEKKKGSWKQKNQNKKEPEKIQGSIDAEENQNKESDRNKSGRGKGGMLPMEDHTRIPLNIHSPNKNSRRASPPLILK